MTGSAKSSECRFIVTSDWMRPMLRLRPFPSASIPPRSRNRRSRSRALSRAEDQGRARQRRIDDGGIRSVTKKPLRLDANEGFKTKEEAVRKINWLESLGAQFIEQPLPAHMLEEQKWVRGKVHLPILADEACLRAEDIPKIADAYDGVVIKLDKTGGLLGRIADDRDRPRAQVENDARMHGVEFGDHYRGGSHFAAGGLRRPRRQPADRERSIHGCKG